MMDRRNSVVLTVSITTGCRIEGDGDKISFSRMHVTTYLRKIKIQRLAQLKLFIVTIKARPPRR